MGNADRREPDLVERETLLAYDVPPPPADMADRVLGALRRKEARPRAGRRARWIALAASVAVAAIALLRRGGADDVAGHRLAAARESIAIGARAVAVAEPGSELAWTVRSDGTATVDQRGGDVFYRVTPGPPFRVSAAGAGIRVLGTCFRVEVSDVRSRNKLIGAGAAGALVSAAVLVTVHEGSVLLENAQGEVALGPGEQGRAAAGTAPARTGPDLVPAIAAASGSGALHGRIRDLEEKLRRAETMVAELQTQSGRSSFPDFDAQERDPSWAPAQEGRIQDRMTRFLGIEGAAVECRRTCCRIAVDREAWDRSEDPDRRIGDLMSDAGLGHLAASGRRGVYSLSPEQSEDGMGRIVLCLEPEDLQPRAGHADRGAEREAMLASSRPAVEACMRDAKTPLDLVSNLQIDEAGEIVDVITLADPLGHPAAACVERALLAAARFAPSNRQTSFGISLRLAPQR
jgi:hypothetical protein